MTADNYTYGKNLHIAKTNFSSIEYLIIDSYSGKDLHSSCINNQCKSSCLIKDNFNSVHHTFIGNRYKSLLSTVVSTESISIPNVIQLTFDEDAPIYDDFIQYLSNSSIHLSQITKMTFNKRNMPCDIIIKMLQLTPNCYKLKVEILSSIESNEDFQCLSKKNKIQDVTIKLCTVEDIQFLIKLCCRLEYIHINVSDKDSQPIISYLLDSKEKNPYLHLLNIQSSSDL
ncbi:unnamed protein product [Adineta steineri]|uniref:Uncharacterized protein n=1 Tax=Adineta steineri TaxID=433720 RepID=A0A814SG67_9BILA|nr:unnamed protein product [Adineta steineri]